MADVKKRDLPIVSYDLLVVKEGFNIRSDMGDLQSLADNIKEHGVKVPFRGFKEKGTDNYVVVDGHRRHAAIGLFINKIEGPFYVPFVLEPQKYNDEQRVIDMFIMNDGKNLTPLEQAEGVRRLQNWGYLDTDIAKKIGKSQSYVSKLSSLNSAPKKMINLIEKGKLAASLAMDIISKGEIDKFLEDFENGNFEPANGEMFHNESKAKKKITKGDLQPVNSWKEFKKFAKNADDNIMDEDKAKLFKWLCRIMNNELTVEQIKRYFK